MDDLVRPIAIVPVDRGPQARVPRDQSMPRLAKGRQVQRAPEPADELLDVVARLRVGEGVEEHARLDRREGIDVLDPAAPPRTGRSSSSRSSHPGISANGSVA